MTDPSVVVEAPTPQRTPRAARIVPRASAAVLLVTLPVIYFLELPMLGWGVAAGVWAFGVILNGWTRSIAMNGPVHLTMGIAAFGMFVRMGVAMLAVLIVGGSAEVGESTIGFGMPDAAVVALVLYTIVFTLDLAERMSEDLATWRSIDERAEEGT